MPGEQTTTASSWHRWTHGPSCNHF